MKNPEKIETTYYNLLENLPGSIPDGIINVDLNFLESASLINPLQESSTEQPKKDMPSFQFHIMESEEKVTLFNNKFAIWIMPTSKQAQTSTLVIIGQYNEDNNNNENPEISLAFSTTGMYNTSKFILKIIEHFIKKIISTERELQEISI